MKALSKTRERRREMFTLFEITEDKKHGQNCMSFIIRYNLWNWESGSVNKTFAAQAQASEFRV